MTGISANGKTWPIFLINIPPVEGFKIFSIFSKFAECQMLFPALSSRLAGTNSWDFSFLLPVLADWILIVKTKSLSPF